MDGGSPCVLVGTNRRVRSISTLHVGPDQTDPRRNPNPNPNPLGGRLEVGRGSPAVHTIADEFYVHIHMKNLALMCVRVYVLCP